MVCRDGALGPVSRSRERLVHPAVLSLSYSELVGGQADGLQSKRRPTPSDD